MRRQANKLDEEQILADAGAGAEQTTAKTKATLEGENDLASTDNSVEGGEEAAAEPEDHSEFKDVECMVAFQAGEANDTENGDSVLNLVEEHKGEEGELSD